MSLNDGYEQWRKNELKDLDNLAQNHFHQVMNPSDCNTAKYLKCTGEWGCGWGEKFSIKHAGLLFIFGPFQVVNSKNMPNVLPWLLDLEEF